MELLLVFGFSASTQSTITSQINNAVSNYYGQSAAINAQILSELPNFSYDQINRTAIENSIQISTSQFITYYASMSRVLVLESSSSSSINPNSVFSSLTISVILCVRFESLYLKLIL